jgi:gamma-D-glutamyl-L-lysine dipeptidyl-peptidase
MDRYICENVFVPLRSGPSHKSEMLSQLLFGEKYIILEKAARWLKVENQFDKFKGWIDMDHLQQSEDKGYGPGYVLNRSLSCFKNDETRFTLEAGCEIYNPDFKKSQFSIGSGIYNTDKEFDESFIKVNSTLADTAMKFINSPYIWGGRTPSGLDCSGYTQLVYKIHGITIPHDSLEQAQLGIDIAFLTETLPGDLAFFDDDRGRITHVGIIISRGLVIHASGRVRIDTIDHQGIFRKESGDYSHHLRVIKRIQKGI